MLRRTLLFVVAVLMQWHPVAAAASPDAPPIGAELPTLPPGPIEWGPETRYAVFSPLSERQRQTLLGLGIDPETVMGHHGPEPAVQAQLKAMQAQLSRTDHILGTGSGREILRLSPPEAPLRSIVLLREGQLYLMVQQRDSTWNSRPVAADFRPSMVDAYDLTGDGRPEIITARLDGSGAHLSLRIFAWNDRGVWEVFRHHGALEPGQYGFFDAEGDGRSELAIDTAAGHGLFHPGIHGPFLRDRLIYRWNGTTYQLHRRYRFATPFYHLNRYLYWACRGDWRRAAAHAEPGAQVDRRLAAWLGKGGLVGDIYDATVNGTIPFAKNGQSFQADFGPTGRLLRIKGPPPAQDALGSKQCPYAPER